MTDDLGYGRGRASATVRPDLGRLVPLSLLLPVIAFVIWLPTTGYPLSHFSFFATLFVLALPILVFVLFYVTSKLAFDGETITLSLFAGLRRRAIQRSEARTMVQVNCGGQTGRMQRREVNALYLYEIRDADGLARITCSSTFWSDAALRQFASAVQLRFSSGEESRTGDKTSLLHWLLGAIYIIVLLAAFVGPYLLTPIKNSGGH